MKTAFASCLAFLPALASGFQPLVTDDTGTQGDGGNQLEFSYTRLIDKEPGARAVLETLPLIYTRGFGDALEIYAGAAYVRFRPSDEPDASGAGVPVLGFKWRFYEDASERMSLAVKPEIRRAISSETEERGLGSGQTNGGIGLLLSKGTDFGAIHANLAVNTFRFTLEDNRDAHRATLWRVSIAPVFNLAPGWRAALDAGLITNPHREENPTLAYVEIGAIYSLGRDLDLALGLTCEAFHESRRVYAATAGVTWRFR